MRKFVISDIHGNGDIYDTIISYLENIGVDDDVHLYINGDLIDRGFDSFRVLNDVIDRMNGKGNISIHYLGGNHELMMYEALSFRGPGEAIYRKCDWMRNGGFIIERILDSSKDREELCDFYKKFMGELKIYHIFDEKIRDNNLLLVHAQAPKCLLENKELRIKDNNMEVFNAVWTRRENREEYFYGIGRLRTYNRIGLDGYFTIKGHTPVEADVGFEINNKENYINIDGGCAAYAYGYYSYDHVPLMEIKDDMFDLLIFNHDNEIVNGFHYDGNLEKMSELELNDNRKYIDPKYNGQAKIYKKQINELFNK